MHTQLTITNHRFVWESQLYNGTRKYNWIRSI